jgi:hypothetical protein
VDNQLNPGHSSLSKRFSVRDTILTGLFRSRENTHYVLMYCSKPDVWDDRLRRLMDLYDKLEEQGVLALLLQMARDATRPDAGLHGRFDEAVGHARRGGWLGALRLLGRAVPRFLMRRDIKSA